MISDADCQGLNVALNEAAWVGVNVDVSSRLVSVLMDVCTLPADGPAPVEWPVWITVHGVHRVVASLREGWWDDVDAPVVSL